MLYSKRGDVYSLPGSLMSCGTGVVSPLSGKVQPWLERKMPNCLGSHQYQGPRKMLEVSTVFPRHKLVDPCPQQKAPDPLASFYTYCGSGTQREAVLLLKMRNDRSPWLLSAFPPRGTQHISSFQVPAPDLAETLMNYCLGFWSRLSIGCLCLQCFSFQSSFCLLHNHHSEHSPKWNCPHLPSFPRLQTKKKCKSFFVHMATLRNMQRLFQVMHSAVTSGAMQGPYGM